MTRLLDLRCTVYFVDTGTFTFQNSFSGLNHDRYHSDGFTLLEVEFRMHERREKKVMGCPTDGLMEWTLYAYLWSECSRRLLPRRSRSEIGSGLGGLEYVRLLEPRVGGALIGGGGGGKKLCKQA